MKRFLELAFALAFAVVAHAAPGKGTGLSSPVMTNFNKRDFLITLAPGTAPTNIIQLNWGATPNPPAFDLPGNITYFIGGTNLWTNLVGILQPKDLTLPVMITNQLQFGPGTTNVVKRTNGIDVVYVNGGTVSTYPGWGVINTGDNSEAYFKAGGNLAAIYGRSGVSLIDGLSSGNDIRWFNNRLWLMQANAIFGGDTNTTPFFPIGQIHVSTNFIRGFLDATDTNFSWTVMYQPDTNSPMIFDQVTSGTAGASRGFSFRTNGVEVLAVTGTGGPSSAANWVASGTTNSTLPGNAFVHTLLPTNGLQSVAGASATYIGGADIWNMGVNSSSASAIYNNCYSFYNFGTNSAHGIKATNSYSIWNFGLDGLEDSVLNNARNVFNFGADPGWQSQYTDSYNIMNLGFAAGESTLYSGTTHDIVNIGQGAGHAATLASSGNFYMIGNEPGDNIQASGANDVYAFGSGLKNAVLGATKRLFAIGGSPGNSINGAYTNVVLIGDGATLGATGENQIIAGPNMSMSVSNLTLNGTERVYNTYPVSSTDYERGVLDWITTPNSFTIGTEKGGTGNSRSVQFTEGGTKRFYLEGGTGNLLWNTDGVGSIGANGANRPYIIYAQSSVYTGSLFWFANNGGFQLAGDGNFDVIQNNTKYGRLNFAMAEGGRTRVLTNSALSDFLWIAVANTNAVGGKVTWTLTSTDGTDTQQITGETKFGAVAKATTVTATLADVQCAAAIAGGGTLTAVIASNVTTNNVLALGVTPTSSLTTTNILFKWRLETPSTFTVNAL